MNDTPTDDLLAEVEEQAAHPPKIWDPEKKLDREDVTTEESVAGIVEEIDERESGFGPYKVTVLKRRDSSRVSVAWFGAVLEQRSKNLAVGDAVALTYVGRVQPKDESLGPYADYRVVHKKPATGPRSIEEGFPPGVRGVTEPPDADAGTEEPPIQEPPDELPMGPADAGAA